MELNVDNRSRNIIFTLSLFFTSILLHQSNVILGINFSFADFFSLFVLLYLIVNNQLLIPVTPLMFFLVVSAIVLGTATFYIPNKFSTNINLMRIISDYIKLLAIFTYFIIGYNLANINVLKSTVKWYSICGILIGALGIVFTLLHIRVLSSLLFFGDIRFKGLMIDPNYFSVLQITALVYISRSKTIREQYKYAAAFITLLSVVISGSKTGIITLCCYFTLRLVEYLYLKKINIRLLITQLFLLGLILLIVPNTLHFIQYLFENTTSKIPAFERVYFLFTDFNAAISEGGSGRDTTWKAALNVIQLSPLIGVGIGTYTNIAWEMFHYNNVAHNTFLQLSAEWGIPLTIVFFSYVLFVLGKATKFRLHNSETNMILRDIIIILLIGSMAISLNNARVLWLVLGALVFSISRKDIGYSKNDVDENC